MDSLSAGFIFFSPGSVPEAGTRRLLWRRRGGAYFNERAQKRFIGVVT
jgi:hypothetical protein